MNDMFVSAVLKLACLISLYQAEIVTKLHGMKNAVWFAKPVTRKEAPDYAEIVKDPMDLGTMRDNLKEMVQRRKQPDY